MDDLTLFSAIQCYIEIWFVKLEKFLNSNQNLNWLYITNLMRQNDRWMDRTILIYLYIVILIWNSILQFTYS